MHPVTVRRAQIEDAEQIAAVHVSSWQQAFVGLVDSEYLNSLQPADRYAEWRARLQSTASTVIILVAELDGRIVGFGSSGMEDETKDWKVMSIYFLSEAWGSGLGHVLMTALEAFLREQGADRAALDVHPGNARARSFYERRGWVSSGVPYLLSLRGLQIPALRYEIVLGGSSPCE